MGFRRLNNHDSIWIDFAAVRLLNSDFSPSILIALLS
jgi:hypothetical protein